MRWYYANRPSAAVPEGLGDEDAIRAIWAEDARNGNARPTGERAAVTEKKECAQSPPQNGKTGTGTLLRIYAGYGL
jgi:hypothetical protein